MRAHQPRFPVKPTLLAILLAFSAEQALAANCTWNPATGDWSNPGLWSCGVTPGAADNALIAAAKTVTITLGHSILTLSNAGSVNINSFGLNLVGGGSTTNSGVINVGGPSTANLGVSANHNINNSGGVINVAVGSVINQFGSTITGGTINTTGSGALVAFNSNSNFLSGVTLNGTLDMTATGIERVTGGMVLNGGVNINDNSVLSFVGDQTLSGSGTIALGSTGASNRALSLEGNTALTIGSNIVMRGENGTLGQAYLAGGNQSIINNGRISADVSGGTISLAPGNGVTNNGVLEAQNGGTLVLNSNVIGNVGSSIAAGAGSTVLQNGVALSGVINTSGSGTFRAANSNSNFLNGVTLNGTLDLATGTGIELVTGGLTLNGTININNNSVLSFSGDQILGGSGTIVLGNTGASNRALSLQGNTALTIGSNIVVSGENGTLGQTYLSGGTQSLINNGRIAADVTGGTISLAPSHGTTNNGVLEAQNGGTLVLNSNVIGNVGSSIAAGAGSTVLQNGVALSGVINTSGSGTFRAANNNSNLLNGVTLNGNLDLATATGIERVTGGLVLNGGVSINNNSVLSFSGDQTLGGSGTIVLGNTGASNRALGLEGNTALTIGSNIAVRGESGTLGQAYLSGGTQSLINNGRISADVSGGTISLAPGNGVTNNGVLEAQNGGTLVLNASVAGTPSGSIVAGAGSTVLQNGVTLSGVINSAGTGNFRVANSNNNFLDGVTFNGPLDLASATSIERVVNGLTLNGTININTNSVLSFSGDQSLGGNGSIVLGNTGASNRALSLEGNTVLTIGSGVTVRGENGTVGQAYLSGGTQQITNNGSILANVGGGTVILTTGLTQNNALLGAANGGTLQLDGAVTQTGVGQINAANGSAVVQNGVTITGGALNTAGTGRIVASNSNSNFLSGATINGLLDLASATGIERVVNGLTLSGTVNVNNNSVMSFQGSQTLGGNGTIVLGSTGASNRALSLEGNTTLTIASGVTVRGTNGTLGQAYLAGGTQGLVNNGTINSDGGGTITFDSALVNNGLVHSQAGTINVSVPLSGTGTLQVDASGAINLAAGAKTQGVLAMGAAGAALNLNTGNLTITNDYTSMVADSGNAFNRRAGVSGAGQIVAGGDVAQAITGTAVSNGNTANATLTLGNVRVGSTTFDYQVANTGSTGPVLRGAIQTNVNGGNLTDTRLSGAGVTASNYNTGAPGSNTGNLGVTFTAASAGALAPLTGQVLNLRSNFENIADQKLNIVLGSGAAAYNAAAGSATPSPVVVANQRVNGTGSVALTVSNTAAAGAFSEDLNASVSGFTGGAGFTGGNINNLLAGNSSQAIGVRVDTLTSGAKSGTVTLAYETAGTVGGVSNGLGTAGAGSQVINVSGNVYQAAAGQLISAPLNFGTVQVGQVVTQNLVVSNTATGAAGFVEDLNVGFGAASGTGAGLIIGSGSLNGILAGTDSTAGNGVMTVAVNTVAAGVVNGNIAVNFTTAGAVGGVSNGLGTANAGSEAYGVQGQINAVANVINQASPLINNTVINLGNVRVNDASPTQALSITNQATVAPQAALNATVSANAPITASGSFNLLASGDNNNTSIVVGMQTASAGAKNGTATVSFVSDSSNVGNCAPNCQLNLASQNVTVSGAVYRLANPTLVTPSVSIAARVGDALSTSAATITNTSPDVFSEGLKVNVSSTSGNAQGVSSIGNLAAQGSAAIQVGLASTATAAVTVGNVNLGFVSTGAGTTGAADTAAQTASGSVTVNGKVYTAAVGQLVTPTVDFGIVRVGDTVNARDVTVSNSAAATALNDTLHANLSGLSGPLSGNGSVSGIGAQASGNIAVGLDTASAGIFNQTGSVGFLSQNPDMADISTGANGSVQVKAQINNLANADFDLLAGIGVLQQIGFDYVLDLGNIVLGSSITESLQLDNDVAGPADVLRGLFDLAAADDFNYAGWDQFSGLDAGSAFGGLRLTFNAAGNLGLVEDTIVFNGFGYNTSDLNGLAQTRNLVIRANVVDQNNDVPEPGTLLLMAMALAGLILQRRRSVLN